MKNRIRILLGITLSLLLAALTGCSIKSPESLYRQPQQPDFYYNLQNAIDSVMKDNIEYSAPVSGENRQAIQMKDLDGDGREEAIVFAKTTGEHPLRLYIFSRSSGDEFSLTSTIEGDGVAFDTVRYAQVDGSPGLEILVGRSLNEQVPRSLSVYTLDGNLTLEMVSVSYTAFELADLDDDGRSDLFLLRQDSDTEQTVAALYRYSSGALVRENELSLSGKGTLKRMVVGKVNQLQQAVFVASQMEDDTMTTDVFVLLENEFKNIATNAEMNNVTVRSYPVYAADIDNDGLIELPDVISLPGPDGASYQIIEWYNLYNNGTKQSKLLTYHDYSRGFYLELDQSLKNKLLIRRDDDVEHGTAFVFSIWNRSYAEQTDCFTIYLFTGDDAVTQAQQDERALVYQKNELCVAVSIQAGGEALGITASSMAERFHPIRTDWYSGEM